MTAPPASSARTPPAQRPVPRVATTDVAPRPWLLLAVLMLLSFVARVPGLMGLPIFCDEAIYLRWSQLIHQAPWQNLFVSLADPKPPLHYWLVALVWPLATDPLHAARLVSVAAGVLTVPAVYLLCRDLEPLFRSVPADLPRREALKAGLPTPPGRAVGIVAALLVIACPFLAFYQRMALADALFFLECVVAGWLGVRLGVAARQRSDRLGRGLLAAALPLGLAMAVAMYTRQIVSYELWALPVAAFLLMPVPTLWQARKTEPDAVGEAGVAHEPSRVGMWQAMIVWLLAALVLACLLWLPYLLWPHDASLKTRILYQPQFADPMSLAQRLALMGRNFVMIFVPTASGNTGWYWVYLTPPVYLLSLAALGWLAVRRQWRLLALLLFWLALMVGPLIVVGSVARSRYVLFGILPLLVALAFAVADWVGYLLSAHSPLRLPAPVAWGAAGLLLAGLLAWPLVDLQRQNSDWQHQRLVPADQYQYVSGWTGGQGAMRAVRFIRDNLLAGQNKDGRLVVITDNGWGTPADALWVYLSDLNPSLQLYYVDRLDAPILQPAPDQPEEYARTTYLLRDQKWRYTPAQPVRIPPAVPVVLVVHEGPDHPDRDAVLRKHNPGITRLCAFDNPPERAGEPPSERVVIYRVQ